MAHYATTVRTPQSPSDAFAAMSDLTRFPEWDPGIAAAVRVRGEGPVVGAAYDLTLQGRNPMVLRYEVVEADPPRQLKLVAQTRWLRSVDEIRVVPDGAGARVTYDAVLTLNGPLAVFDVVLGLAFRRIGDRAAAGLRRFLNAA